MNNTTIDAVMLSRMFLSGARNLESKKEWINELNVFPVPDGDTGSNMSMTISAAARDVSAIEDPDIKSLCKAIRNGSLRGARGNSGVILSQLFRGFTKSVSKYETLGKEEIAAGFGKAVETAYKAVMKPKEGTILTVAKGMAEKAEELLADQEMELLPYLEAVVQHGYEVLKQTPELLPVLKEAGVVDSGGQGLMEVLQGCLDALTGKAASFELPEADYSTAPVSAPAQTDTLSTADIKFGYCTEFIIMLNKPMTEDEEDEIKKYLLSIGDSLVCVADEEICKIHVHTNHPGQAFEKGLTYGALSNMKVDNMRIEHNEKLIKDAVKKAKEQRAEEAAAEEARRLQREADGMQETVTEKEFGFVAVSVGEGFSEIFSSLGVDEIIEGGQTMNPSTEDILNAIDQVHAEHVFVFPNNKNIILAAEQARDLTEDKEVHVLPTTTIPQGIAAMVGFMPEAGLEENLSSMEESFEFIKSGEVTYAVRDTVIEGKEIHSGDYMGISDKGIAAVGSDIGETVYQLVKTMADDESELITIYYGQDVQEEDAAAIAARIEAFYKDCEVEVNYGGQPIYYYLLSVE